MVYIGIINDDYLEHHGVKGMKWGVRRQKRKEAKRLRREIGNSESSISDSFGRSKAGSVALSKLSKIWNEYDNSYNTNTGTYSRQALKKLWAAQEEAGRKHGQYVLQNLRKKYSDDQIETYIKTAGKHYSSRNPNESLDAHFQKVYENTYSE